MSHKLDEYLKRYNEQKNQMYFRDKTSFQISFDDWKQIWIDSGQWENRGRQADQYCFGRIDHSLPLTKENSQIIQNRVKSKLARTGKVTSDETKEKMRQKKLGVPKTEEHKKAMSLASRKAHHKKGHTLANPLEEG